MKKRWIAAAAGSVIGILAARKYGMNVMQYLHARKALRHPGNAAEYGLDNVQTEADSFLKGKTIAWLGSSVTFGAASGGVSFADVITRKTGARMIKEAVSGTTLVDEDDTSYVARMHNIPANETIDLFVVQLSTNDASRGKPLGEISEARPFDTKTVTGAIQEILTYVRETWNCPVMFYTGSWYESPEYEAMVKRLYELQETYGFGIADLYTDKAFNDITDEQRALYMFDPIHPVKAGYLLWWAPQIEKQIIAYLK